MAGTGAKTKLTAEVHAKIVQMIGSGSYLDGAARACRVTPRAVHYWLERGKTETRGIYHAFFVDCEEALGKAELRNVLLIEKHATDDWRAAAFWLERRNPKVWGQKSALMIELKKGLEEILEAVRGRMSKEAYAELIQALADAHGMDDGDDETDEERTSTRKNIGADTSVVH